MTIITFPYTETKADHPHIRRFDLRKDLLPVADLVERCFADTLDVDGRRYIMQMRSTAGHPNFLRWAASMAERMAVPFNGFVWEQDGEVVGNLSLIPMHTRGQKIFLVANVAVHPDHRRRGIARRLTEAALDRCARLQADQIWLHVRDDNPGALALYRSLGFVEQHRRTTWQGSGNWGQSKNPSNVQVGPRRSEYWNTQLAWLDRTHPFRLDWYLPLNLNLLRPGFLGWLYRAFKAEQPRMWAASYDGQLVGTLTWIRSGGYSDRLWLATRPEKEALAVPALLAVAHREIPGRKTVSLEYPAGLADEPLQHGGFEKRYTLIWMRAV
jgi:ribosomal protein S18 acetylase RimI-like enzyme